MAVKKHEHSLELVFLQYLLATALTLALAVLIPFTLFSLGMQAGLYNYANANEIQAKNAQPTIAAANPFDSKLVPASCTYVLLSQNHTVLQSNMKKRRDSKCGGLSERNLHAGSTG